MQQKTFLFGLMANLFAFSQAWAAHEPGRFSHGSEFSISSSDGKYKLGLGGLLQENNMLTYTKEGTPALAMDMTIAKARINVHGNVFDPSLSYWFQTEFAGKNTGLLDYYVDKQIHGKWAHVRVGQFSTPFSRPWLISPAVAQFWKASDASDSDDFKTEKVTANRDVGLMVHNGTQHEVEYALAVQDKGVTGRIGFNHGAIDGYNPTDFAGGDLRFGVGVSAHLPIKYFKGELDYLKGAADLIVKYHGFSSNAVLYFKRGLEGANKDKNFFAAGADFGYLIKEMCEPVLRYSLLPKDQKTGHEIYVGLNHYGFGNHLKAQAYLGTTLEEKFERLIGGVQFQIAL